MNLVVDATSNLSTKKKKNKKNKKVKKEIKKTAAYFR